MRQMNVFKFFRQRVWPAAFVFCVLGFIPPASAHKNHAHHKTMKPLETPMAANEHALQLEKINEEYKREVKPIFQRACFDCHTQSPRLPWYHSLPIVHGLLESDMQEAKVHLDFSDDFPFKGHGSPEEDLKAIADAIEDRSMPPLRYRIMHPGSGLSENERKNIHKWISEGELTLKGQAGGR
ncbi:MAG: heme-binding domain-containing protein [Pseudobdellovibrionaceae bacterium]